MLLHFSHVTFWFFERLLCLAGLLFSLLFVIATPFSLVFLASTQKLAKIIIKIVINWNLSSDTCYVLTERNSARHLAQYKMSSIYHSYGAITNMTLKMLTFKRSKIPLNIGLNFVTFERGFSIGRIFYNLDVYPESNFQSNFDKTNGFLFLYLLRDLSNLFLQPIPLKILLRQRNCFQFLPLQFASHQEYL